MSLNGMHKVDINYSSDFKFILFHQHFISGDYSRLNTLCRLRSCKNRPAPFPGRMSYKATKPGSACLVS